MVASQPDLHLGDEMLPSSEADETEESDQPAEEADITEDDPAEPAPAETAPTDDDLLDGASFETTAKQAATSEFRSMNDGRCLTATARPYWKACDNSGGQKWSVSIDTSGWTAIRSATNGQCLDVREASRDVGAQVILYTCHGGANQQFRLEGLRITVKHSGHVLDQAGDGTNQLIQYNAHGAANQQFQLAPQLASQRDARTIAAMRSLVAAGYSPKGAAGIVGNLLAESALLPNRVEGSSETSPMRSADPTGVKRTWTAEQIRDRVYRKRGPALAGVGLAQWTTADRRAALFTFAYQGTTLGAAILYNNAAQLSYLDNELSSNYRGLRAKLMSSTVSVSDASDDFVYLFEIPGAILKNGKKPPRSAPEVQRVFAARRTLSDSAFNLYTTAS